jgi:hypothetical protein
MWSIHEKTRGQKSRATVPLMAPVKYYILYTQNVKVATCRCYRMKPKNRFKGECLNGQRRGSGLL